MPGVLERRGEDVDLRWWRGWRCLGERERRRRGLGVEDGYGRRGDREGVGLHIYNSLWYTYLDWSTTFSLSLIPLVHVVDQEETGYGGGHQSYVSSPIPWGIGDAYAACGASMCPWDMGGGFEPIGVLPSSLQ